MLWTSFPTKQTNSAPTLVNLLKQPNLHLLLSGPPGIGKSSLIYNYKHLYKIIELNASSDRGINTVRNTIKDLVSYKEKIILLIDEADYMTVDAQSALRKLFEMNTNISTISTDYNNRNTKLILTCNDKSKLISPIRSRMYEIKLNNEFIFIDFREHLRNIILSITANKDENNRDNILNENILSNKMLSKLFWYFEGDKRAILNFLQITLRDYSENMILNINNLKSGTDINNSKSGTDINNSKSGTDINNSKSGTDINNSETGTDINNSKSGTDINNSKSGTDINNSKSGTDIKNNNENFMYNFLNLNTNYNLVKLFNSEKTMSFLKLFKRTGEFDIFKKIFIFLAFPLFQSSEFYELRKTTDVSKVKSVTDAFLYFNINGSLGDFVKNVSYEFISQLCVCSSIEEVLSI
ncbi:Replication factor C subunit 3 [Cucumispora dikerogammari]|nr:Replication factor C subunit 3 [Cucumispora dikerogammari]